MADEHRTWRRQDEGFWRAHHEAWKRSDLNQRQYCEAEGIPLKAFGNWRAQFKAEPQPSERKLLYRRRPLSPPLSPPISPLLSPVTYPSSRLASPIVPRPREGHRRRFSDADKHPDSRRGGAIRYERRRSGAPPWHRWPATASMEAGAGSDNTDVRHSPDHRRGCTVRCRAPR